MSCSVDGCEKPVRVVALGLCDMHYRRVRNRGTTEKRTAAERFWKYAPAERTDDGCWEWTGHIASNGYALLRMGSDAHAYAHRFSYELLVGPIPEGLQVDHLCRNRACVNPRHLEPVTQRENILRSDNMAARWARRTECDRCGGPFSMRGDRRYCPVCERERRRRNKAKRAA